MFRHLAVFLRHPASTATGLVFAACGFVFGTWASMIPYVKNKFDLNEAGLGLLLLCMPVGTLVANALSVRVMSHHGAATTSRLALSAMGFAFSLPVLLPEVGWVGMGLCIAGASFALTNIAMNTCATYIEDTQGVRIMAALHGMWSAGATIGALISGPIVLAFKEIRPFSIEAHFLYSLVVVIVVISVALRAGKDLPKFQAKAHDLRETQKPKVVYKPSRELWVLIAICLCTFLAEGTMADWSAVYLREITIAPEAIVGWGFGLYAFCMAFGRFIGDGLIDRYGATIMLRICGFLVIFGFAIITMSQNVWIALPGFMLTGFGISLASPILYAASARLPDMPIGAGLAMLNTFGMASFLGGPVLIGFVGSLFDLRVAFAFVGFGATVWVGLTYILKKNPPM